MKILGNRVLVSKVEEPVSDGFQAVEVQDSFVNKGKVEQGGFGSITGNVNVGDIILFAKFSPDTHEIEYEGKKMKIISFDDILAIYE